MVNTHNTDDDESDGSESNQYTYEQHVNGRGSVFATADYNIQIVEGGTYKNQSSKNKFIVKEVDSDTGEIVVQYTYRHPGWPTEGPRERQAEDMGFIEALGDTPQALFEVDE